jgi:hypothetical protein
MDNLWDNKSFEIKKGVLWKELENELVVLNLKDGSYFTFNESARQIWSCLIENQDLNTIVENLVNKYSISTIQATNDVEELLSLFLKEELIVTTDSIKKHEEKTL